MRVGMLADPAMHWSQCWMTYHHPHAMTRIKSIIKCIKPGYNGNKQLESRGLPGPSFEQRQELGWYGRWERPGCRDDGSSFVRGAQSRLRLQCVHPLLDPISRGCLLQHSHSISVWFLQRQKEGFAFVQTTSLFQAWRLPVLSKCKYGNYSRNVDSVSSLSATNTSPRCWDSSPLRSLSGPSLRLSGSLSCSVTLALWTSPRHSDTHSHDTQVRTLKML